MTVIQSGSSGNCSFLLLDNVLFLFDLGISYKKIYSALLEQANVDLNEGGYNVCVLLTHTHGDHWKTGTYRRLEKLEQEDKIALTLVYNPDFERVSTPIYNHQVDAARFSHGETYTYFYVIDKQYGYLTDCDGVNVFSIPVLFEESHNLKELLIESNYDEAYLLYPNQIAIANGYNVVAGFKRHLSKQQSECLVNWLQPEEHETIHHSSRFWEVNI